MCSVLSRYLTSLRVCSHQNAERMQNAKTEGHLKKSNKIDSVSCVLRLAYLYQPQALVE